jgi:multidrug efflux system membrane fusion protein
VAVTRTKFRVGGGTRAAGALRALALASGLLLAFGCRGERGAEPPRAAAVARGVRVEAVATAPVRDTVEVVGTVRSKTQTVIASKVQGYVREVRAREGDLVEAGDLLIVVADREFRAQVERDQAAVREAESSLDEVQRMLDEAHAALRSAEADHEYAAATAARYRLLMDRGLIAAQDHEQTEARRKSTVAAVEQGRARILSLKAREEQMRQRIVHAKAQLRTSEVTLEDTRIATTSTGVVVSRRVEPGNLAVPGQPLLVLDDPHRYRLEVEVGESAMGWVRLGQSVPVMLDSIGRAVDGRVAEIVPAADPGSRSVTVKLDMPPQPGLRSGLFGRASFPAAERLALLVPTTALVERGQLTGMYVVDGQNVGRLRLVTAGPRRGDRVEILSGLSPGEHIVTQGAERVADGSRVEALP